MRKLLFGLLLVSTTGCVSHHLVVNPKASEKNLVETIPTPPSETKNFKIPEADQHLYHSKPPGYPPFGDVGYI